MAKNKIPPNGTTKKWEGKTWIVHNGQWKPLNQAKQQAETRSRRVQDKKNEVGGKEFEKRRQRASASLRNAGYTAAEANRIIMNSTHPNQKAQEHLRVHGKREAPKPTPPAAKNPPTGDKNPPTGDKDTTTTTTQSFTSGNRGGNSGGGNRGGNRSGNSGGGNRGGNTGNRNGTTTSQRNGFGARTPGAPPEKPKPQSNKDKIKARKKKLMEKDGFSERLANALKDKEALKWKG